MAWLRIALDLYLAGILGVAGIAKMEYPEQFAASLRRYRLIPRWGIARFSRLFPCGEVILACALMLGAAPLMTAVATLMLFLMFLAVEAKILHERRGESCGCFGDTITNTVDGASIATSALCIVLAMLHLYLVTTGGETSNWVRGVVSGLFLAALVTLGWRTLRRRRAFFPREWHGEMASAIASQHTEREHDVGVSTTLHTSSALSD